jgi:hypothetical protein
MIVQNYYVASLVVSRGKNKGGFLTSQPLKSLELASRDVLKRVERAKPVDLRVRMISAKEAKLLRRIDLSRRKIQSAAEELQSLHSAEDAATTVPGPAKRVVRKTLSRLVRRKVVAKKVAKRRK